MKYIKVTHIESGNEQFFPLYNVIKVNKSKDRIIIFSNDRSYTVNFDTKEYEIQEVNNLF